MEGDSHVGANTGVGDDEDDVARLFATTPAAPTAVDDVFAALSTQSQGVNATQYNIDAQNVQESAQGSASALDDIPHTVASEGHNSTAPPRPPRSDSTTVRTTQDIHDIATSDQIMTSTTTSTPIMTSMTTPIATPIAIQTSIQTPLARTSGCECGLDAWLRATPFADGVDGIQDGAWRVVDVLAPQLPVANVIVVPTIVDATTGTVVREALVRAVSETAIASSNTDIAIETRKLVASGAWQAIAIAARRELIDLSTHTSAPRTVAKLWLLRSIVLARLGRAQQAAHEIGALLELLPRDDNDLNVTDNITNDINDDVILRAIRHACVPHSTSCSCSSSIPPDLLLLWAVVPAWSGARRGARRAAARLHGIADIMRSIIAMHIRTINSSQTDDKRNNDQVHELRDAIQRCALLSAAVLRGATGGDAVLRAVHARHPHDALLAAHAAAAALLAGDVSRADSAAQLATKLASPTNDVVSHDVGASACAAIISAHVAAASSTTTIPESAHRDALQRVADDVCAISDLKIASRGSAGALVAAARTGAAAWSLAHVGPRAAAAALVDACTTSWKPEGDAPRPPDAVLAGCAALLASADRAAARGGVLATRLAAAGSADIVRATVSTE